MKQRMALRGRGRMSRLEYGEQVDHSNIRRQASAGIGIDVGGSKMAGVVIEPSGSVVARTRIATPGEGGESVADACLELSSNLLSVARSGGLAVGPVVLAMPGTIDSVSGVIRDSPILKISEFGIVEYLQNALAHPVTVIHDVKAAAFGELMAGAGIGQADVAYLNIGTGVSMAFVFDWEVHRGVNGIAGEVGHVRAVEDGLRCNCGRFGCLETVASGPGIARVAPRFGSLEKLSAAAQQGDPEATGALAGAAEHLGRVLSEYMMVLDLQVLMVGGGVSNIGPPLLRPMQESFDRHLADVAASVRVVPAALGSDSGVLGAAHRSRLLRDDRRSARW